jgi:hypothetical protein
MAQRPIFIPSESGDELVIEQMIHLRWNSGFAAVQKEKNVSNLHHGAAAAGFSPVLEISTKSPSIAGRRLSAFNLIIKSQRHGELPLESAFQGSKVFEGGGPYTDLYFAAPKNAKRDPRIRTSGKLVGFVFDGYQWSTEPQTAFYDWLYISFFERRAFVGVEACAVCRLH